MFRHFPTSTFQASFTEGRAKDHNDSPRPSVYGSLAFANTLRALTHEPGTFFSALSNRCKAIHVFGPQPSQAWSRPSSKKMQMVGAPKACCLTFRSRGRPNGMAHWPSSAGPAAHFALAVQRAMPSGSPLTQTLGSTQTAVLASQSSGTLQQTAFAPAIESKVRTTCTPPCQFRHTRTAGTSCHTNQSNGRDRLAPQLCSGQLRQRSRPSAFPGNDGCPRAFLKARHAQFRHKRQVTHPRLQEPQASLWCQRLGSGMLGKARQKPNAKFTVSSFQGSPSQGALFKFVRASPGAA
jgi:hypothetical protein